MMTIIALVTFKTGFWFRIFNHGISIELASKAWKGFSEREGYEKPLYLFGLKFKLLGK